MAFYCVFSPKPPRLYGIYHLFSLEASEAIRDLLCVFCLTPPRLYGIILLFLPDASVAIWHVTYFRLTPLRLYGIGVMCFA